MTDFEAALQAKIARNEELAEQRRRAEAEMDRAEREARERAAREAAETAAAQRDRHAALVDHLTKLTDQLRQASPDEFVVRRGWTESGEEFIAKVSTRGLTPARSLFVELDRDDDEVLARWHSDVGASIELWRLLEVGPELLSELVLQVADQDLWHRATAPPAFPRA